MQNELIELQTQLAFQEQTIAELNDALTSQQAQIDQLRIELKLFQEKVDEDISGAQPYAAGDEKPPHY